MDDDSSHKEAREWMNKAADEIESLRRIIYDLLDDGDETDRVRARAALGEENK
jgi:hypothetical protein